MVRSANATEPGLRLTADIADFGAIFAFVLIANAGLFPKGLLRIRHVGALGDKCGDWAILT
jgi:hypothetical protein